ncbi:MAG: efflux RND transporter periplasmic adaptor subunit [Pirellulaceae bacterium]|nr:efflux RND transporter periplasmic adaptor subunit [Pirellulaceae bacterium]
MESLKEQVEQVRLQINLAEDVLKKSEELKAKGAVTGAQVTVERAQLAILRSQLAETESKMQSEATEGIRAATAELARRKQQLSEAKSQLQLMKLGTREEEIAAEKARCQRLSGELDYLKQQKELLVVKAPASGLVSAPRLREKVGQFAPQGSLLCQVEDPGVPQDEIYVNEDDAASIHSGQNVQLKARSLPFETFSGLVLRVSPAANRPRDSVALNQSLARQTVVVHCSIEGADNKLKSGMTGFGRVYRGKNKVGAIMLAKAYRYVRTEFCW